MSSGCVRAPENGYSGLRLIRHATDVVSLGQLLLSGFLSNVNNLCLGAQCELSTWSVSLTPGMMCSIELFDRPGIHFNFISLYCPTAGQRPSNVPFKISLCFAFYQANHNNFSLRHRKQEKRQPFPRLYVEPHAKTHLVQFHKFSCSNFTVVRGRNLCTFIQIHRLKSEYIASEFSNFILQNLPNGVHLLLSAWVTYKFPPQKKVQSHNCGQNPTKKVSQQAKQKYNQRRQIKAQIN